MFLTNLSLPFPKTNLVLAFYLKTQIGDAAKMNFATSPSRSKRVRTSNV